MSPIPNQCIRVDILGSLFMTIRSAYSSRTLSEAHCIVEQEIQKLGDKAVLVLYLDGGPSEEKRETQVLREDRRKEALSQANIHLEELDRRVTGKLKVRKHHFKSVSKNLSSAYAWSMEARQAFAEYMRSRQWNVVTCETEADVKIAMDCRAGDVVVSRDSDMLIYSNITTIWRPISKDRVLVYKLDTVLATLKLNRTQLTVLGIVSKNDYGRNIYSLGSATNYAIIKEKVAEDAPAMVKQYLADTRVVSANARFSGSDPHGVSIGTAQWSHLLLKVLRTGLQKIPHRFQPVLLLRSHQRLLLHPLHQLWHRLIPVAILRYLAPGFPVIERDTHLNNGAD
ncbi:hypothetical protein BGZ68_009835 [Mortierella alpina]|nr:hypothetical protein BGZ68_009835 [Mortierella alpina]